MTGFGRSEAADADRRITVELKSVNNRFLDLNIRMPRILNALEAEVRAELKQYMKRGKVDIFISCDDLSRAQTKVMYHQEVAAEYVKNLKQMAEDFGLPAEIRLNQLAGFPDVLTVDDETPDAESFWPMLKTAIDQACTQFAAARAREGAFLQQDLLSKLDEMQGHVAFITERSPQIIEEYKNGLREKVQQLLGDVKVDEARLLSEVTIFADKVCVDEELVRLSSHIEAVRATLEKGDDKDGIGRRLDFLVQEMNRESNTILSKSTDMEVSNRGVELKTLVEKIREQIQNIE